MTKRRLITLFVSAIVFVSLQMGSLHSEEPTPCEKTVKHNKQTIIELEAELSQIGRELEEERELRKELQEQLNALTELEENINERETLDNTNNLR